MTQPFVGLTIFLFAENSRDAVDCGEVDGGDEYCGEHVPEGVRDKVVEEDENGIVGRDRVHIIDLNDLACGGRDIVFEAMTVQRDVDEVDDGVCARGDADGREDTSRVKLAEPELEKQDRDAHFEYVREEIEAENGIEELCLRYRIVQKKRNCRTEGPEQSQIRDNLAPCEDSDGKHHRVERAEMEGKILER